MFTCSEQLVQFVLTGLEVITGLSDDCNSARELRCYPPNFASASVHGAAGFCKVNSPMSSPLIFCPEHSLPSLSSSHRPTLSPLQVLSGLNLDKASAFDLRANLLLRFSFLLNSLRSKPVLVLTPSLPGAYCSSSSPVQTAIGCPGLASNSKLRPFPRLSRSLTAPSSFCACVRVRAGGHCSKLFVAPRFSHFATFPGACVRVELHPPSRLFNFPDL